MDRGLEVDRARLAAIVESSQDAILAKDLTGCVTAWNPAAQRLYGYSPHEILGRPISLLIPPELAGESEYILAEVLAGRAVPPRDTQRVAKDGSRVNVSVAVSPIRDAAGTVIGASTIARDISDRLAAEAERVWTTMLVDQAADAILALDHNGRITTWNPAAEKMFGFTAAEAFGQRGIDVVGSDELGAQAEISEAVLGGGQTRRYEARRLHRDGTELIVEISIAPLSPVAGRPSGAVITIRNETAARMASATIKNAQDREAELLRELEQSRRLESVGQLAGGIAHDFNNLLSVIINLAMMVAEDLPMGSAMRADVDELATAAQRAATLTRQLLIFSRRDVVDVEVLTLNAVVDDLAVFLRRALGEAIALEVDLQQEIWPVEMDRGQVEQVIVNLAVNARDAMQHGGRLIVETRNTLVDDDFAHGRVGLSPGEYVTLTVSDNGEGMEAEVAERAFEPFFTTKPKGQGTGLGLATVYGIVTAAGGRVAIYSERGRGTSINVHLPVTHAVPRTRTPLTAAAPRGQGERLLIVEDAADVRRITERILSGAGYDVVTATTGAEALEIVRGTPIALLLTDVIMPGMTGTDLVRELRRADPHLKVVFMSGYSGNMLTPAMLEHAGSAFIEKPFTADQLRRKIRSVLERIVPE